MTLRGSKLIARRALAVPATILVAAALSAAGCGADSDKDLSVADAKAKLSKDCQEGNASDKKLCDCIADEIAKSGRSGKQIDEIRKDVNKGNATKAVTDASRACGLKLREDAAG